jgi:hypothetical protein
MWLLGIKDDQPSLWLKKVVGTNRRHPLRPDEPGSARQSVALEPSSKSILNSALASSTDFTLPPSGIVAGPAVLTFIFDPSSKRTETAPGSMVAAFTARAAITFVSFWFLPIVLFHLPENIRDPALQTPT